MILNNNKLFIKRLILELKTYREIAKGYKVLHQKYKAFKDDFKVAEEKDILFINRLNNQIEILEELLLR